MHRFHSPAAAAAFALTLTLTVSAAAQERPIPLDTVQVTVSSIASPAMATTTRGVQVITAGEIRRLPVRTIPDVLQWAMGVDLMPRSAALVDVAMRGSSFEQVLVLVDGVRVSDSQTGHFDLDLAIPLEQLERVEILRGAAGTLHGSDAMGGVINVVTRRGAGSSIGVDGGSFASAGLSVSHGGALGGANVVLGGEMRRSDGHRPGTDSEVLQGRVAVAAPVGFRRLDLSVATAARNFGARGFYGSNPDWDEYERTRTTTASVALRPHSAERLALEPVLSFRQHRDDFLLRRHDPAFYRNRHRTDQFGGKLTARYAAADWIRLAAGGEGYHDVLTSSSLGDRSESHAAVLAEAAMGRVGAITVVTGARLDWHERHGTHLSPSISAGWWPVEALRLRASVGHALRAPTWTERYYRDPANEGSADLSPERSWSSELGVDLTPRTGFHLGVALFERRADDLIDWARAAGSDEVWVTRNVDRARFRGLEAQLEVEDALGTRWSAQGSWLSVRSSTPSGVESKYALRPLTQSVTFGVDRPLPGGFDVGLRALHARRTGEAAYLRADLRTSVRLARLRLYLDLQNLGDAHYLDITGMAAPGRSVVAGGEFDFEL